MKRLCIFALMIASSILSSMSVEARQIVLTPEASARIVNPGNEQEVQVLYKFTLPGYLENATIVVARLDLNDVRSDVVPFTVIPVTGVWGGQTSWNAIDQIHGNAEYRCEIDSAISGKSTTDLSKVVRAWLSGEMANHGFTITKRQVEGVPTSVALSANMAVPTLTIMYTRNSDDE